MRVPTFSPYELLQPATLPEARHHQDDIAEMMCLLTMDMVCPTVRTTEMNPPWSQAPVSEQDANNWKLCSKTGLKVPQHMQATYKGRVYDRRYVPQGPHD